MKNKARFWKTAAIYGLFVAAVLIVGLVGKDRWYAIATSLVAAIYLLLLNDGKRVGYLLCALYGVSYGIICIVTDLYASGIYHILILAPSGLYRFWKNGGQQASKIRVFGLCGWVIAVGTSGVLTAALFFLLRQIGDAQPLLDGATLAISGVTAYLLARNFREMWLFNLFSTVICIAVWSLEFIASGIGLSIVALQSLVLLINLRGMILWNRREREMRAAGGMQEKKPLQE